MRWEVEGPVRIGCIRIDGVLSRLSARGGG
jgi:hypothetical protein